MPTIAAFQILLTLKGYYFFQLYQKIIIERTSRSFSLPFSFMTYLIEEIPELRGWIGSWRRDEAREVGEGRGKVVSFSASVKVNVAIAKFVILNFYPTELLYRFIFVQLIIHERNVHRKQLPLLLPSDTKLY